jgi:hypothetical protein
VRAVKISARLIERASDTRSRSLVCETALAQGVPGFSLLSERYGEGASAHCLELSSQTLGLFQVCHGDGFGGCHFRLGRRRLGALLNELGCLPAKGDSRNFVIERPVLLPGMMAVSSLAP